MGIYSIPVALRSPGYHAVAQGTHLAAQRREGSARVRVRPDCYLLACASTTQMGP